ncbi:MULTISPECIES: carbonate dehydratase [Nitrincola]|uniref:Carbonic anhydrase n=1 Tax=Nitrincola nitratireducens TaxID=1229521 RepID=W9V096_9GAMM|nr:MULTISPECIES: carbonate dehydratase [Nitrincola]EXJ10356.1 Carbonic anhydrase 2 [Nitrincola nitratireducens]
MKKLSQLFKSNQEWSARIREESPEFFPTLAAQQAPEYLWIGCSDSRVPANEIVDLLPGELFVHRNVSNLVIHTDMNCLSVLQYAVQVLKVKHVMVVGHYGCGGVKASLDGHAHGLIDNWLGHIRDVYAKHREVIGDWQASDQQFDRMCELNVIEQAENVCNTTVVREAWARGQELTVHGWIYSLNDGLITDLNFCVGSIDETDVAYERAVQRVHQLQAN